MRRLSARGWAVVAAAAAAGAAVAAILLASGESTQSADEARTLRGRPVVLETRTTPRMHAFGETVTAELVAVFNRALVRADSVRARARFDPYEVVGGEQRSRVDEGTLTRVTFRWRLQCLSRRCLPGEAKRPIEWEDARVGYSLRDPSLVGPQGARTVSTMPWPTVEIVSRLDPSATQDVRWRAETRTLPEPDYRIDPALATVVLLGGAGALVGLAGVLLAPLAPRRRPVEEEAVDDELPPLERALLLLETGANGAVDDRRRLLELVARELAARGDGALAERARRLAWSREAPSAADAAGFAASARARGENGA